LTIQERHAALQATTGLHALTLELLDLPQLGDDLLD
jgi:hypothetical protein